MLTDVVNLERFLHGTVTQQIYECPCPHIGHDVSAGDETPASQAHPLSSPRSNQAIDQAKAHLPVRHMVGAHHFLADVTLPYGRVVYDYNR
jgi:hypothetical protein